jgi:hypothetical protein
LTNPNMYMKKRMLVQYANMFMKINEIGILSSS